MADCPPLKEDYTRAKCCMPSPPDEIVGYYSHDNVLKVHRKDCPNLGKAEAERLVVLVWADIVESEGGFSPGPDYAELEEGDFVVLAHHEQYGVDYSLAMAALVNMPKEEAFRRHAKLREMGLLERVEPRIIQYRKGIVDNKWIKHRNHTYYDLTAKGRGYLGWWRGDAK